MNNSKIAIISGGGQGIGKAIAKRFLEDGYAVVIAEIDSEAGQETAEELSQCGSITFIPTDIADEATVKALVAGCIQQHGRLDVLVNNAAIINNKPITELSLEEWNQIIAVNLSGAFLLAKHAAPYLRTNHGCIINITSTRAWMSEPHTEAYSASKGGLTSLTHALAMSLAPEVRVNSISPGWIEVGDWQKNSRKTVVEHNQADRQQHPVGRVGKPEDIAALAAYLASDEAGFITAQDFVVDGGMTHKMIYV